MKIQILKKGKLLKEYEVIKDSFTLGRSDECDITILEDGVARKHIEFKKSGKKTLSFVKKSKFGLLSKEDEPLTDGNLSSGESLEIGDLVLSFLEGKISEEISEVKELDKSVTQEKLEDYIKDEEIEKIEPKKSEQKKVSHDFDFFTMAGGEKEESVPNIEEKTEDKKEEDAPSRALKQEDAIKEIARELKKGEETAHGQPAVESIQGQEIGEATVVGSTYLIYQLIAISGPYKDKIFALEKDVIIIGRAKNVDVVLVDDLVSREHSRLYKQGVDYYLIDLGSSNGSKVNGKKILEPIVLSSGDIIEIGSSTLRFMVINPQAQNIHGVDLGSESFSSGKAVIEKVAPVLSDGEINKIEKSFGASTSSTSPKKKKLMPIAIAVFIAVIAVVLLLPDNKKQEKKKNDPAKAETTAPAVVEEKKEAVPEVQCSEQGSFCQQPPGVQRQLLAEYDVGVKLFKNFQFELAEDRAQQILSKVPDWPKAKELLELSGAEKDKLINQKKEEEDAQVRKMLEQKLANFVREAKELMRQKKYDKVKDLIAKIFEIDPNNQEAKKMIDEIENMKAQMEKTAQKRAEFLASLSKYKNSLKDGKKFYERKEYMKAIDTFQRCLALPQLDSSDAKEVREECKQLMDESNRHLRETITPELTVAEELFTSGQFREAIASYQRVLKIDYKNKTAKMRIGEARSSIEDDARDNYSRAAIAESVSDFKNACLLYYKVLQISIPGSKYYSDSLSKTKKLCNRDKSAELN
ncbi:MAG: FHA domain-containing protein [bacterium]